MTRSYRIPDRPAGGPPSGRRRPRGRLRIGVAALATVLAVAAGSWGGYRLLSETTSCADPVRLSVAAVAEIEPVGRAATQQWAAGKPQINGRCVAITVTAVDPADITAAIAGQHQATLTGVGQAAGEIKGPDILIPDSSAWAERLRAGGKDWVPDEAPSIARSPVVLAMPQPAAATFGWPDKKVTWADLLTKLSAGGKLR